MRDNRAKILNLIQESTSHPTAEDIYRQLQQEGKKMTLATVYNNLSSLCASGDVKKLVFNEKTVHYDKMRRHDHMVCGGCGRILDVDMEDLVEMFRERTGVDILSYDLKLYDLCEDCAQKKKA